MLGVCAIAALAICGTESNGPNSFLYSGDSFSISLTGCPSLRTPLICRQDTDGHPGVVRYGHPSLHSNVGHGSSVNSYGGHLVGGVNVFSDSAKPGIGGHVVRGGGGVRLDGRQGQVGNGAQLWAPQGIRH